MLSPVSLALENQLPLSPFKGRKVSVPAANFGYKKKERKIDLYLYLSMMVLNYWGRESEAKEQPLPLRFNFCNNLC